MLIDIEELFHTAAGTAFADILVDGRRETWPIRSKRFRGWLRRRHYQATGDAASAAEIRSALDLLEARAQFDGPERAVHVRIAEHAGHIYLDLADEHWRAVDIGPDGWRVIGCPPVRFRRPSGMLPLPVPQQGGSIDSLNSFLNLATRDDFILTVAWLLAALRSGGPYPLLAISGEQGSAKTVRPEASTLPSAGKAGPEAGSLGYVQLRKISSVPSAASATSLHRDWPVTFATTPLAQI
jgi:hypothetical protein